MLTACRLLAVLGSWVSVLDVCCIVDHLVMSCTLCCLQLWRGASSVDVFVPAAFPARRHDGSPPVTLHIQCPMLSLLVIMCAGCLLSALLARALEFCCARSLGWVYAPFIAPP
jgi:hypothetical protein